MTIIDKKFSSEILSENASETLKENLKVLKDAKPQIELIKEDLNTELEISSKYDLKLSELYEELKYIESENTNLHNEIKFNTKVFEKLRELLVKLEIQSEYFEVLHTKNFTSESEIVKIENALAAFDYNDINFSLRVIDERKSEIENAIKSFFKRFKIFFNSFAESKESTAEGELKIHTLYYESIKKYENFLIYCKKNLPEYFINLLSIYKEHNKRIYKKEFENHLKVISKVFSDQKNCDEILEIFFESFFLIIKAEIHFCKKNLQPENLIEFINDTFVDIIDFVLFSFTNLFEKRPIDLINALEIKEFDCEEQEKIIWQSFCLKIKKLKENYERKFLENEKEYFISRSRQKNVEITISNVKKCKDSLLNEKLLDLQLEDILRQEYDLDDKIYIQKLLIQLRNKLNFKEKFDKLIGERFKSLEKEIITYCLVDDKNKIVKNVKKLVKSINECTELKEFLKVVLVENCDAEYLEEVNAIFNK